MIHFIYNFFLTKLPEKKKNRTNRWINWQLHRYLKVNLIRYCKNLSTDALGIDPDSNVIVSLTSFPERIASVHLAIKSVLNQNSRPKNVILWLGQEFFPTGENQLPTALLELKPFGLEIKFRKDIKAHTKYFYAFQEYSNNLIVTVDDDIIYPKDLLSILLKTHHEHPNCVVANRVRYMEMENNTFKPYRKWKINKKGSTKPSKRLFATGVGGVLYKPEFFSKTFFDSDAIEKTNCLGDDIWLKAGQIANDVSVVPTRNYLKNFIEIPGSQTQTLFSKNVFEADNDRQIKEVFKYFGITETSFK